MTAASWLLFTLDIDMLNLDIRTLSFLATLTCIVLALGLQIVNRVIARDPSFRLWAMGATAFGAGFVLLALRDFIPDLFSIVLANTLLAAGATWQYLGNRAFQGRPHRFPWYWWLTAGTAIAFFSFTYLMPNLSARIVIISAVLGAIHFASAFVLLRPSRSQDRSVRWFVAGTYLLFATFLGARAVANLFIGPSDQNFMAATGAIQTFAIVLQINLSLVLGIGLPLLVLGRTHGLLMASEQRYRTLIEWSPAPMGVHDGSTVLYVNPAAIRMFGASSARDLLGRNIQDLVHPDFHQLSAMRTSAAVDAGGVNPLVEAKYLRLDGSVIDAEVQSIAILYDGKPAVQVAMNDITERKSMQDQVRQLAFHDPLTGLPNRRLLSDRLNQAMTKNRRSECFGAVMFLDLDNFKPLNDRHGHAVGDLLLSEAATRLSRCVRQMDTVARFGGDEFVVMISELEADHAESAASAGLIAEKIRTALSEPYVLTIRQDGGAAIALEHHCTASIGLTLFSGHETSQDEILKSADVAMYQAKAAGRNLVHLAPEAPQPTGAPENVAAGFMHLTWRKAYECGNAIIDKQHRTLFRDANTLLNARLDGDSSIDVGVLIDTLMHDVVQHFSDEEALFRDAGFPGAAEHVAIHRHLVDSAAALVERFHAGTLATGELFEFLAHSLVARHILAEDRAFFPYLTNQS